ncbi:MAG: hypothetical protein AAGA57_05860 [Planctomycetota bacterium]
MTEDAPAPPAEDAANPAEWVGRRVAVLTQVAGGSRTLTAREEGVVLSFEQRKTGSWFAHSKDDKLWLDRLTLRKDDGEVYIANLDALSRIELLTPEDDAEEAPDATETRATGDTNDKAEGAA